MSYEAVIGLEIHAQLLTETKIFCGCPHELRRAAEYARLPGLPRAAGRAAGAEPARRSIWPRARPSRLAAASTRGRSSRGRTTSIRTCRRAIRSRSTTSRWRPAGAVELDRAGRAARVGITRVHMEEDAGKSLHEGFAGLRRRTYVDFNRGGVPLIEIVTRARPALGGGRRGVLRAPARHAGLARRERRQHGRGQPALRRQRVGAPGRARRRSAPRPR